MQRYIDRLRNIESGVHENGQHYSQKTIDLVQNTIQDIDYDDEDKTITRDKLGAISYEIDILLEIWNPDLMHDIDLLARFNLVIDEWCNDTDFINIILGIPRHE